VRQLSRIIAKGLPERSAQLIIMICQQLDGIDAHWCFCQHFKGAGSGVATPPTLKENGKKSSP